MNYESRDQIPESDRWDLTQLYPTLDDAKKELTKIDKSLKKFKTYRGKLLQSKETLLEALQMYEDVNRRLGNFAVYTHQSYDLDTRNADFQALYGQLQSLYARFGEATSWMTPEILAANPKDVKKLLKKDLKVYEQFFDNILRAKKHTLSDKEEALLASMSEAFQTPGNVFGQLNNADFQFPTIKD